MNILFVCKGNAGRSQMAEAFFNRLAEGKATSVGTDVGEMEGKKVHEYVVQCMQELGYNLSQKRW